jgi:carbamoyl-phosphate synthase large subunit
MPRSLFMSVADRDKSEAADLAAAAHEAGFALSATPGTAAAVAARGLPVEVVDADDAEAFVRGGRVGVVVNTPTQGHRADRVGFALRRVAFELNVPAFTSLDSAWALVEAFAGDPQPDLVPLPR